MQVRNLYRGKESGISMPGYPKEMIRHSHAGLEPRVIRDILAGLKEESGVVSEQESMLLSLPF